MVDIRELQRGCRQSPDSPSDLRPEAPHMLRRERCTCLVFGGDYAEDCQRTRGTRGSRCEPAVQPPNDRRQDREINMDIRMAMQWIALGL